MHARVHGLVPKLAEVMSLDDSITALPFLPQGLDGSVDLRDEPIDISRRWQELVFLKRSPYMLPTPNDLIEPQKKLYILETALKLKRDMADILESAPDGWVTREA